MTAAKATPAHTPGPWTAESRGVSDGALVIKDAEFNEICVIREKAQRSYGPQDTLDQANARRIVACVNACEGMLPEVLDEYANEGGMFLVFGRHMAKRDEEIFALRAEVERLREALQAIVGRDESEDDETHDDAVNAIAEMGNIARAALGGQA